MLKEGLGPEVLGPPRGWGEQGGEVAGGAKVRSEVLGKGSRKGEGGGGGGGGGRLRLWRKKMKERKGRLWR